MLWCCTLKGHSSWFFFPSKPSISSPYFIFVCICRCVRKTKPSRIWKRKWNWGRWERNEWDSDSERCVCVWRREREKTTVFCQMTAVWRQCVLSFIIWRACLLGHTHLNSHSKLGEPRWEESFYYHDKTTNMHSVQYNVRDTVCTQQGCSLQWTTGRSISFFLLLMNLWQKHKSLQVLSK